MIITSNDKASQTLRWLSIAERLLAKKCVDECVEVCEEIEYLILEQKRDLAINDSDLVFYYQKLATIKRKLNSFMIIKVRKLPVKK